MEREPPSRGLPHDRVVALSDLVFGLALSIGAIVLVTQTAPTTSDEVISSLVEFGFSFLVLIRVWTRYTTIMADLPVDTPSTRNLNLFLLFLVSVEPYLFYLLYGSLGRHPSILLNPDFTTGIYSLDLAGLFAILGFMTYLLAQEEKTRHFPELVRRFQFSANTQLIAAVMFLVAADGVFWRWAPLGVPLRFWLWGGALFLSSLERAYVRRRAGTSSSEARPPPAGAGSHGTGPSDTPPG